MLDKYWVEVSTIPPGFVGDLAPPLVAAWISNDLEVANSRLGVLLPRDGAGRL